MIELESNNCCPATGSPSNDASPIFAPQKVSGPVLVSRIKQSHPSACIEISGMRLRRLEPITHPAGEPQIVFLISSAMGLWNNMVNLQLPENVLL
jgi:hypothetical protein